jgi:hypothetical protein
VIAVLGNYARQLDAVSGRLYRTGISDEAYVRAARSGKLRLNGPVRAYRATSIIGESTRERARTRRLGW